MDWRSWGMLVLLAALWGASFLFIRIAAPVLGPAGLAVLRVGLGGLTLLLVALAARRPPALRSRWRAFLLLGALNAAIPITLVAVAELRLTASLGATLNATIPLFTALVAAGWGLERLSRRKVGGLLLGGVGVGVLVGWSPLPLTVEVLLSVGASLAASFFYGVGGVYSKVAFKGTPPLALALGQLLSAALLLFPCAAAMAPSAWPPPLVVWAVLGLAGPCTALAYLLYFGLMTRVGPTRTHSVTFLIPVFGLLWAWLFLGESLSVGSLLGFGLILLSLAWVTGLRWRWRRRQSISRSPQTAESSQPSLQP